MSNYGPIASIWFDGWAVPARTPEIDWRIAETYALIRSLQPQTLISYKWGLTGDEDYLAPEHNWVNPENNAYDKVIEGPDQLIEICFSLGSWGYVKRNNGKHPGVDRLNELVQLAKKWDANLLTNIAPRPDGSLDPQDVETVSRLPELM